MLSQLYIQNIAVIQKADIHFTKGLNVFTGETGAGKSILIGAIGAILGERTNKDLIRGGESKASISAVFCDIPQSTAEFIRECGFEAEEDGELLISREITASSNTCRINGKPATVAILKQIGERLVNIHGQQDNHMLYNTDSHRKIIDAYGGLAPMLDEYTALYKQYRDVLGQIDRIATDEKVKAHKIDLLTYQIKEIEEAQVEVGEEQELSARRTVIKNASRLAESLSAALEMLEGSDNQQGAVDHMEGIAENLSRAARYMSKFSAISEKLSEYRYELEEVSSGVRNALEELEYDPHELDAIELRLDTIYRLKKKYGSSEEEILTYLQKAQEELEELAFSDAKLEALHKRSDELYKACVAMATDISLLRRSWGDKLAAAIEEQLEDLDMKSVRLVVAIAPRELSSSGADEIEFLISTNKGEEPKPMSKIASGGEISRIMLAIKTVTSGNEEIGTLIFDEVDAGVSGRAAQKIGAKLKQAAANHQVLCVTHLSQVAVYGEHHLLIDKQVDDERTYTQIVPLSPQERVREIARINSGELITELALDTAKEMLGLAGTPV